MREALRASDVEEDDLGVLDALLDLSEEEDGLTTVDDSVVVGEGDVHDGAGLNLVANADGAVLDGVHAEDGALGRVDNGGAHHRAENATVGNGEGTAGHVLEADLAIAGLNREVLKLLLNAGVVKILAVAEHGDDETGRGGNCDRDVDEVAIDDIVSIDDGVDNRLLLEGGSGGLNEGAHESELDVVLLGEDITDLLADVHEAAHINLVEGCQHSVGVLSLLQSLGNAVAHAAHGNAGLSARAGDACGSLRSGLRLSGSSGLRSLRGLLGSCLLFLINNKY